MRSEIAYGPRRQATELSDIEREIDKVLQAQRARSAAGEENALDVTTLNVAAHRLQSLIHDRRILLTEQPREKSPDSKRGDDASAVVN